MTGLEDHPTTKIRLGKGFAFANLNSAQDFEEQRARFFGEQERLDDYVEMREGLDLAGNDSVGKQINGERNPDRNRIAAFLRINYHCTNALLISSYSPILLTRETIEA